MSELKKKKRKKETPSVRLCPHKHASRSRVDFVLSSPLASPDLPQLHIPFASTFNTILSLSFILLHYVYL